MICWWTTMYGGRKGLQWIRCDDQTKRGDWLCAFHRKLWRELECGHQLET